MTRLKLGAGAALVFGIVLTAVIAAHVGFGGLVRAVDTVGWSGFAFYCLCNLLVFAPLGAAWWTAAPGVPLRRIFIFVWGRMLREAAADVLPLAQVGGLVVGIRAVGQRGVAEAVVISSLIIDLTTEMAAQLVYTLAGIALLAALLTHVGAARALLSTTLMAFALGGVILAAFVFFQGRMVDFLARISGRWLKDSEARAGAVRAALTGVYARPSRLAGSFALHAVSWVASGLCSWLALALMGARIAPWQVLALESLLAAVRSVAFMTPGALGVQEGAYVVAAPLFGLPPETALALSLMKRAKDILIGAPALLVWQAHEGRRLVHSG